MSNSISPDTTPGPLDSLYTKNFVIGIILSVCCGIVGLVCSIICLVTTKDPVAKKNAIICLILPFVIGAVLAVLNIVAGVGAGLAGR